MKNTKSKRPKFKARIQDVDSLRPLIVHCMKKRRKAGVALSAGDYPIVLHICKKIGFGDLEELTGYDIKEFIAQNSPESGVR